MFLNDIRALVDSTLKTQFQGSVMVTNGLMPEEGSRNVSLTEYGGMPSEHTMGSEDNGNSLEVCEHISFVAQSRAENDYETARNIMEIVYKRLNGLTNYKNSVDPTYTYQHVVAKHPPFHLGNDEKNRPLISCNFEAKRSRT